MRVKEVHSIKAKGLALLNNFRLTLLNGLFLSQNVPQMRALYFLFAAKS